MTKIDLRAAGKGWNKNGYLGDGYYARYTLRHYWANRNRCTWCGKSVEKPLTVHAPCAEIKRKMQR